MPELGGGRGRTKEVPSTCQPSSDKTGLLCANINNSKGHVQIMGGEVNPPSYNCLQKVWV